MWILLLLGTAHAEIPLPSYRDVIVEEAYADANADLEAGLHEEAVEKAEKFQKQVVADASLEYLIGLSWRLRQEPARARTHYERAIALDPTYDEAWYDVGELYLMEGRWDEAERAFGEVAKLVSEGPKAWVGPWRLAEVAAHRRDPVAFEEHMHVALRNGFTFRLVQELPNWKAFYADPVMHDSVEKLVTVYADPSVLESLQRPVSAPTAP